MTAQLEHPGTPAVYDTGIETSTDGPTRLWLVMQLLRGSTLEALLDRTDYQSAPPPMAWAAAIAAQIAAVLADVHRVDIVHRDIKPSNVMVVDGGLVKVLDFGIAILRGAGALPRLTQVDRTVGTPAYMSPEQWLGQVVTSASDIYSLGCVLLELLTGDAPFFATPDMALRSQHLSAIAPSARSRRGDLPVELDTLVSRMLAKDPSYRPTAETVYETLLPLTVVGAGVDVGENRDPTRPFRWPLLAPAAADKRAGSAEQDRLTDAEVALLLESVRGLMASDRPAGAIGLLEDGIDRTGHDPALQLRLRHRLGAALFYAGEYTRAAAVLSAAGRDYQRWFPPDDPDVLECAHLAGYAYAETGKAGKALPLLRFFVQNADASADADDAQKVLETRFVVAQMLAADGYPDEAFDELQAIRPLLADAYGLESTQVRNLDKQAARLKTPQ